MPDDPATRAITVDVDRERQVAVVFEDGRRCAFALEELRVNCPCATCRGVRDRGERPWPRPGPVADLRVEDASLVGAWGLGIRWNDGHSTGIYPWEALRRWCEGRQATGRAASDERRERSGPESRTRPAGS